jgi:hypothetical protein
MEISPSNLLNTNRFYAASQHVHGSAAALDNADIRATSAARDNNDCGVTGIIEQHEPQHMKRS